MEGLLTKRIFIVDDHQVVIDSLQLILGDAPGFKIVGATTQPLSALQQIEAAMPHILITDVSMPGMNGIELTKAVKSKFQQIKIIALSMFNDSRLVAEMIDAGISGYLLKNSGRQEMITALTKISAGESYFSADIATGLMSSFKRSAGEFQFTEREMEVINLMEKNLPNSEIAALLNLGERTVEIHRKNILNKTKSNNIAGEV